jgi:hypothetical protein
MHNEPLGGCCLEQSVLENCKYNEPLGGCCLKQSVLENCKYKQHPPRGSLCIVLAVLKDRLLQTTSTKRFIVLAVLKDRLYQTTSTKRFIVYCTCSSQGQIAPDNIHQEVHCALYLQFSRTNCSRQHPPRGSLCIVLAVLKDRLHQTTSTTKFIVVSV